MSNIASIASNIGNLGGKNTQPNFLSKLSESYRLKSLFADINGYEVPGKFITSLESVFGGTSNKTQLSFIDYHGLTSGSSQCGNPLDIGGTVKTEYTDPHGCAVEKEHKITKVHVQQNKEHKKLITVELEDQETSKLKNSFKTKGHQDKEFSKAIEEHVKDLGIDAKKFIIQGPQSIKELKENFIFHSGSSFFHQLGKEAMSRGFYYITDKFNNSFIHKELREFNKLMKSGLFFNYGAKHYDLNRILQYNMSPFDGKIIQSNLPTKKTQVTNANINAKENREKGGKDTVKDNKKDPKNKDLLTSLWMGEGTKVKNTGDRLIDDVFDSLSNSQTVRIWVPGMHMNYIGTKIDINLPVPRGTGKYNDEVFSGEYEVVKSRDMILSEGYFLNELLLRRPPTV